MNVSALNTWTQIASSNYTGNYYQMSIWVYVSEADITNNQSKVITQLRMKKIVDIPDSYESWATTSTQQISIDSSVVATASAGFDFRDLANNSSLTLASDTSWISHDSDGDKTISISVTHTTGVSLGTKTLTGSATLPSIPRTSSITLNKTTVDMNGTSTIIATISRATTSFTHKISFQCGNYLSEFTDVATSYTFTVPAEWNNAVTSSDKGTATVTVTTFSGTTQIGNPVSLNFEVTVPTSIVPSISTFTSTRNDNDLVPSSWGVYVQSKSKVNLSINSAVGSYGSRITEYNITGGGYTYSTATATTGVLNQSGTITFTATITDSRGRVATATLSVYVYEYTSPVITSDTLCYRSTSTGTSDDDGSYVTVKPVVTYSSVSSKNTVTIKVNNVSVSNNANKIISGVSTDTAYTVTLLVSDSFSSITKEFIVPTALVSIDFHNSGKGIAIGKVSETANLVEVDMDLKINDSLTVVGDVSGQDGSFDTVTSEFVLANDSIKIDGTNIFSLIYPVGAIYMSVNSTSPSTLFGGTWLAWGSGRFPVGINTSDSDFSTSEKTGSAKEQYLAAYITASTGGVLYNTRSSVTSYSGTIEADLGGGASSTTKSLSTATEVRQYDGSLPSLIPPYITCYMWKRTA